MQVFTPNEFSLILSGVPRIDVEDWQRNTEVTDKLYVGVSIITLKSITFICSPSINVYDV